MARKFAWCEALIGLRQIVLPLAIAIVTLGGACVAFTPGTSCRPSCHSLPKGERDLGGSGQDL